MYAEPARAYIEAATAAPCRTGAPAKIELRGRPACCACRAVRIGSRRRSSCLGRAVVRARRMLFDGRPAIRSEHDPDARPRDGVVADRDREPLVRSADLRRAVRRPARPRRCSGCSTSGRRSATSASHLSLVSSGAAVGRESDQRRADRRWRTRSCSSAFPRARTRHAPAGDGRSRAAGDVLARARAAARGRRRRRRCAGCSSPATGSTPACRPRSRAPFGAAIGPATPRWPTHELDRRPLQGAGAQGTEPSVVRPDARPQPAEWRWPVSTSSAIRSVMGRIEIELGPDAPLGRGRATACGVCSASPTSRTPAAARTTSTRWRRRILRDLGDRRPGVVPRAARGDPTSGSRSRRRRSNAKSAAASRTANGWRVDLERPGADDPHRDAAGPRVLLLRQGAGRRRPADRHGRPGRLPAVGRHRFAGRGVPDDAPRLLGAARSTFTATRSCRGRRRRRCARSPRC